MSTTEIYPNNDEQKFLQAEMLQNLDAAGPLTSADYQNQMDAMFGELKANRNNDVWAARAEVWDRYVTNGPEGPINTFSQVMLRGGYDNHYSGVLNQCEEMENNPYKWSPQEMKNAADAKLEAKTFLVESNHLLRSIIEEQGDNFTGKQLFSWYTKACEGKAKTAEGRVMGAASEIAVKRAMEAMGVFRSASVQYGDIEQDLLGMDIVGQIKKGGVRLAVDVKTGKQETKHFRKPYGLQMIVGVPHYLFDDHLKVDQEDTEGLAYLMNLELAKAKHSPSHHSDRQGSIH